MEIRRFPVRRILRWSLAALCAVLLWIAGYFGGRDAGYDRGREAGFAAGRDEGLPAGRLEGMRRAIEQYSRQDVYTVVYAVDRTIEERFARRGSAVPSAMHAIDAEMGDLIDEIFADVAPDHDPIVDPSCFEIRSFPANRSLVVSADGARHAEVTIYLESKDDYLAWKQSRKERR